MSRIDLHLHTTHSDGSLSPVEVLRLAHKAKVTALAITDHDIVSGIPEAIAAGAELGIEIIPGVEISSCVGNNELHILGYCIQWQDPWLNQRLATLRESRHRRNPQIIERLRSLGLDVTYEEVQALASETLRLRDDASTAPLQLVLGDVSLEKGDSTGAVKRYYNAYRKNTSLAATAAERPACSCSD